MSDITGSLPKNSYKQLLQIGGLNVGITGSFQAVQDCQGNVCPLQLSNIGVKVNAANITINGFTYGITGNTSITGGGTIALGGNTLTLSSSGTLALAGFTVTATGTASVSGTNTGDQTLSDAALSLTDVTTNNASTSNHGFLKKLSNVSTQFMNGQGNWIVPPAIGSDTQVQFNDGGTNVGADSGLTYNKTSKVLTITKGIIQPSQASFQAVKSTNTTNATGDGTTITVVYDSVSFDRQSNYNNSTGIFTAPVTGMYLFTANMTIGSLGSGHTTGNGVSLVTTARTYFTIINYFAIAQSGSLYHSFSWLASMTAGDTAKIQVQISGSTKTVAINSDQNLFSGFLLG